MQQAARKANRVRSPRARAPHLRVVVQVDVQRQRWPQRR
jgi:hypothetical protein